MATPSATHTFVPLSNVTVRSTVSMACTLPSRSAAVQILVPESATTKVTNAATRDRYLGIVSSCGGQTVSDRPCRDRVEDVNGLRDEGGHCGRSARARAAERTRARYC